MQYVLPRCMSSVWSKIRVGSERLHINTKINCRFFISCTSNEREGKNRTRELLEPFRDQSGKGQNLSASTYIFFPFKLFLGGGGRSRGLKPKLTNYSNLNSFALSLLKIFKKFPKAIFPNTDCTFECSSFLLCLHMLKLKLVKLFLSHNR